MSNWKLFPDSGYFIIFSILAYCNLLFTGYAYVAYGVPFDTEPGLYRPVIEYNQFPKDPVPIDSSVRVYAHIVDYYGEVNRSSLTYSCELDNFGKNETLHNVEMKLINGSLRNGTFVGVIPPMSNECAPGIRVNYMLSIEDNLNYQTEISDSYTIAEDTIGPDIGTECLSIMDSHCFVSVNPLWSKEEAIEISDLNSGIKNVTFYYGFRDELDPDPKYDDSVQMTQINGDKWSGNYSVVLPISLENNTIFNCEIRAFDESGNSNDMKCHDTEIVISPISRDVYFDIRILDINLENQSFNYDIRMEIPEVNSSFFVDYLYKYPTEESTWPTRIIAEPDDWIRYFDDSFSYASDFYLTKGNIIENNAFRAYLQSNPESLLLQGTPSLYPFDTYHINLKVEVPLRDAIFRTYSELGHGQEEWTKYWIFFEEPIFERWNPLVKNQSVYKYEDVSDVSDTSTMSFKLEFSRNHTISIIIMPLIAIFFLLGAIVLFENSLDNIGNRLTLTLGIFALIFTLPEIIDSMKPDISGPTIADAMLSTIILSTIAFTVSSILTSNSIIQQKFPKHYKWGDILAFFIVICFLVQYFHNFPLYITLWLVPLLIFGLGYGLLLRAFKLLDMKNAKKIFRYVLLFTSGAILTQYIGSVTPYFFSMHLSSIVFVMIYLSTSFIIRSMIAFYLIIAAHKYTLGFRKSISSQDTAQYHKKNEYYSKKRLFLISCLIMGIITQPGLVYNYVVLAANLLQLFNIDIQYFVIYFSYFYEPSSFNLLIFVIIDLVGLISFFIVSKKGIMRTKMIKELERI